MSNITSTEARPSSYANFTAYGLTFCAEAEETVSSTDGTSTELIPACIVYMQVQDQSMATRVRATDASWHKKITLDGTLKEEENYSNDPDLLFILRHLYLLDNFNERIIAVPVSEVEAVYSPQESLIQILMDEVPGLPKEVVQSVQKAVRYLIENGIPLEDIGIYGGLQTFVTHLTPDLKTNGEQRSLIKDIDLVIYGLEHANHLKLLAQRNQNYATKGKNTRVADVNEEIRQRRHKLTRIYIPDENGLFCDIKVIRKDHDENHSKDELLTTGEDLVLFGTVVNAQEALCPTSSFQMRVPEIGLVTVSSSKYNFIAAVSEGDVIEIKAASTTNPTHFLLTNPLSHYISYTHVARILE